MNSQISLEFIPREPRVSCFLHPTNYYSHLCLSSKCIKKCLCRKCLTEHQPDHNLISIKDVIQNQTKIITHNISQHNHNLKTLHQSVHQKISTTQKELNNIFESLKTRIDDIFRNINESSNDYITWARSYIEKISDIQKNADQEKLRGLVQVYKIIDELSETFNYTPNVTFDDFLSKLGAWSVGIEPINKILENAYVKRKYKFDNLNIEKEYGNSGHKCSNTRATASCGSVGIFTFDSTEAKKAPLLICYPKQEAIVGSYHESVDNHGILSLTWMESKKLFFTGSSCNIKCFYMNSLSKIKCISSIKRLHGLSLIYVPKQELIVSTGRHPHCRVVSINHGRLRAIHTFNHELRVDERCTDGVYISSENHLVLCFPQTICIYDMSIKRFTQEIITGGECLTMRYLAQKKVLILGIANHKMDLYRYNGQGSMIFERKIETKASKPCCIVTDEEETQLLVASNENYIESCELEEKKTQELSLKFKFKINTLIYFKDNKKIIGVGDGNFVFVLGVK